MSDFFKNNRPISMEELDEIYEKIEKMEFQPNEWVPTIDEIREYLYQKDMEECVPFLLWVAESIKSEQGEEAKKTKKYINKLLIEYLQIED